jgi:peptide/nickel transport system ATP-binding protein
MYAGRLVEQAPVREIFGDPKHPYTRALLASLPGRERGARLRSIDGTVPGLASRSEGCAFAPRCPDRFAACAVTPGATPVGPDRDVRCHLHDPAQAGGVTVSNAAGGCGG